MEKIKAFTTIFALTHLFIMFSLIPAFAQETQEPDIEVKNLVKEKGKYKLSLNLVAGPGLEKIDIGKTNEDKDITISGGGGVGLSAVFGYLILDKLEIDLGVGFQNSTLSEKVENAEGTFVRTIISFTAKYLIPVSQSGQINLGLGMGYHLPGDMDIDASEVPNGTHQIIEYDPAPGFHILAEYEGFFEISSYIMSWNAGLVYTSVSFDATSYESDDQSFDVSVLKDEYKTLNGNSVNFIGGISLYF